MRTPAPATRDHVSSYDFVHQITEDGPILRLMTLVDEFSRLCLAINIKRRIHGMDVFETLVDAMLEHGIPMHIRSDNGPEMTAEMVRDLPAKAGTKALFIEPSSPWENRYCESFNGHRTRHWDTGRRPLQLTGRSVSC